MAHVCFYDCNVVFCVIGQLRYRIYSILPCHVRVDHVGKMHDEMYDVAKLQEFPLQTIPFPVNDLFIHQMNSDKNTDVLNSSRQGILPISIVSKTQQGSKSNSFKVTLNISNVEKMMDPST